MKRIKTARGKILDMGALATQNETTRAVSNVPVNARGDIIDNRGNVKVAREDISQQFYKDNVPGADTTDVSIKQEKQNKSSKNNGPVEVNREMRTRADGTVYFEIEYDDGSMEEVNA